jgi:hypothetical protein
MVTLANVLHNKELSTIQAQAQAIERLTAELAQTNLKHALTIKSYKLLLNDLVYKLERASLASTMLLQDLNADWGAIESLDYS